MAKKKAKKRNPSRFAQRQPGGAQHGGVKLSQCMIVKNEERNIEKALSWAKNVAFEQIVVDTGSTDRTVELAEAMGAKVYRFEWINDFAAAKNHAIEQASGNWIAFLDADEYIEETEVNLVIPLLELIMSDPKKRNKFLAVNCPWVQLNDQGQPKEIYEQERIFQNLPSVRYIGRIHERLSLEPKDIVQTKDFRIMHTGYTGESFILTGKASRNVDLLREELATNPDDFTLKAYLAESLLAEATVEKTIADAEDPETAVPNKAKLDEADKLYKEVLASNANIPDLLKKATYEYFMKKYMHRDVPDPELEALSERAHREFPNDHDFMCYYAMALNKKGDHRAAFSILKKCEASLDAAMGASSALTTKIMGTFSAQMVLAAQGLGDLENIIRYAEVLLLMDKTNAKVLPPYIATLMTQHSSSIEEVLDALARTYDMSSKRDLLILARAAKDCGAISLARRIIDVAGYLGDD